MASQNLEDITSFRYYYLPSLLFIIINIIVTIIVISIIIFHVL